MPEKRIILNQDDITKMDVDAIVNAANSRLASGGGVDGAIHRAAGSELLKECKTLNGCETGSAKITKAYDLPSQFVIHAVGPVWRGGSHNEKELLKNCYLTSLYIAAQNNCKSIAFPNISTGIYGFPKKEAAEIAIRTIREFIRKKNKPENIFFVCFDKENYTIYKEMLK